jgi:hypothetical protein
MGTVDLKPEALEATRLFNQYCHPEHPHWKNKHRKQATLAMLGSGIFGDNELKGHAKHKTTYRIEVKNLIYELVNVYCGHSYIPSTSYVKEDILREFGHHFAYVIAIARLASIRKDAVETVVKDYGDTWGKKISNAADKGKIPTNWRNLIEAEVFYGQRYQTPKMAHEFADIFLSYCPSAPPNRIAGWVIAMFKSLGLDSPGKTSLSDYIKKRQKEEQENIIAAGEDINNYQKKGIQIRY